MKTPYETKIFFGWYWLPDADFQKAQELCGYDLSKINRKRYPIQRIETFEFFKLWWYTPSFGMMKGHHLTTNIAISKNSVLIDLENLTEVVSEEIKLRKAEGNAEWVRGAQFVLNMIFDILENQL